MECGGDWRSGGGSGGVPSENAAAGRAADASWLCNLARVLRGLPGGASSPDRGLLRAKSGGTPRRGSGYPTASRYGSAVLVKVKTGGAGMKAVLYYQQDAALSPGDQIFCTAKLRAASPDNLERDEYYASRGVWAVLSVKGQLTVTPGTWSLRHLPALAARRLKDACRAVFPEDVSGFLIALLTGDKQGLSYSLKNDLSRSGIYHVVAVSGMHVSLLAGLIMLLCANKRTLCAALGIPAVWFFVLLTGAGASSVRAGVMQSVLLLSGLARRERDSWTALSLAGILLLTENPWAIRNVGLLLSFASTGGILLFSKPLYHAMVESRAYSHLEDNHPKLAHGLRPAITAVCCSIASSAFSLPICAYYFKLMSVSGFVTNALCLWLVSGIFSAGLVTGNRRPVCGARSESGLGGFLRGRRVSCSELSAAWRAFPTARFPWKTHMPRSGRYFSSSRSGSSV